MKPGIRVIRGPDWRQGNQDGGPGYLGTVVKLYPNNNVLVRWDIGNETECRAGQNGAFDLRLYDNAQLGVSQTGWKCDVCDKSIYGFRWKCLVCHETDYCTPCYMADQAMVDQACMTHPHVRYVTRSTTVVRVAARRRSKHIPLYGIFPGAEVTKHTQANKEEQERIGIVKELITLEPDAYRSAVKVEWQGVTPKKGEDGSPELPIYRLGADGKVELNMVKPVSPGHVYIDHLPVLDLTMPQDIVFNEGDKVRVDLNLETFTALQKEYGAWTPEVETVLGEEGVIVKFVNNGRAAEVCYDSINKTASAIYLNALTKISNLSAGDSVKIIQDHGKIKKLQIGHGGWQDAYVSVLGETGHIVRIDESLDALVEVNGDTYVLNPMCLVLKSSAPKRPGILKNSANQKPSLTPTVPKLSRSKPPPGVSIGIGVRVVRGPDWSPDFENQDGGEGHVGSIVELCGSKDNDMYPKQCVVVQWDNGERNVYRAGYEKAFDLRLYDNAGLGIKHEISCSECKVSAIFGLRWQCSECPEVTLCSECYNGDMHDIQHQFIRIDTGTSEHGIKVPKRAISKKLAAKGIFEHAKVQRGPDWRWSNQDGGADKAGEVIAIVNFSPDTDRDAAEVTWENGYTNVYRLGYKGRLDVKCVKPVTGSYYYKDHIPVLKLDAEDATPAPEAKKEKEKTEAASASSTADSGRFKEGDRVRIEIDVDVLKIVEENRGAWNDRMTECIGKTGIVIVSKGNDITVDFEGAGRWTFHETVLNKVKEFVPGEVVKVNDSVDHVRMLQTDRGGWNDLMMKVVGRRGVVEEIDEDGDVQVAFGDYTWTFNPECLGASDQKAEKILFSDEALPPKEDERPKPSSAPETEEEKLEELFGAIFAGDVAMVDRIIQRDPQLMLMDLKGKFAIHLACHVGHIDIVKALFKGASKDALLEMPDPEGSTPLLAAVKGGQIDMVKYLVEEGANKGAYNQSSQTAVHMAVSSKNVDLLSTLRDLGFDINHKDMLNQSAIFDAIISNNDEIIQIALTWPGVQVEYQDSVGLTPFCIACRKGNMYAVSRILEIAPKELNNPKQDGYTGLHMAVLNNNVDVIKLLLQQLTIQVDAVTAEQRTPLHLACIEGFIDVVKLLIQNGADKSAVDASGKTCLHLCVDIPEEKESSPEKSDENVLKMVEYLVEVGVPFDLADNSKELADSHIKPALLDRYKAVVQRRIDAEHLATDDEAERTRTRSDPSAPVSLPADIGQTQGQMSRSEYSQGPSSLIIDTKGLNQRNMEPLSGAVDATNSDRGQQQNQTQGQDEVQIDPELCEACEDEPMRFRIQPCGHFLCADCIPKKKMKKKLCVNCGGEAVEVVEIR